MYDPTVAPAAQPSATNATTKTLTKEDLLKMVADKKKKLLMAQYASEELQEGMKESEGL